MSAVPRGRLCAMESGEHHGLERSLARSQVSNVQQHIAPSAPLRGEAQNVGPPLASDSQPADSSDLSCLAAPSRTQTRPLGLAALARRKPRAVHLSSPCLGGDPAVPADGHALTPPGLGAAWGPPRWPPPAPTVGLMPSRFLPCGHVAVADSFRRCLSLTLDATPLTRSSHVRTGGPSIKA